MVWCSVLTFKLILDHPACCLSSQVQSDGEKRHFLRSYIVCFYAWAQFNPTSDPESKLSICPFCLIYFVVMNVMFLVLY